MFQVMSIQDCPEIKDGVGRIVTGVFRRSKVKTVHLWLEGEQAPLGVTLGHPVWSVDRLPAPAAHTVLQTDVLRSCLVETEETGGAGALSTFTSHFRRIRFLNLANQSWRMRFS
jgi:hypothetical protein